MKKKLMYTLFVLSIVLVTACSNQYPFDLDKVKTEKSIQTKAIEYIPVDLRNMEYKKQDIKLIKICKAEPQSYAKDSEDKYKYYIYYQSKDKKYKGSLLMNDKYKSDMKELYEPINSTCEKVSDK